MMHLQREALPPGNSLKNFRTRKSWHDLLEEDGTDSHAFPGIPDEAEPRDGTSFDDAVTSVPANDDADDRESGDDGPTFSAFLRPARKVSFLLRQAGRSGPIVWVDKPQGRRSLLFIQGSGESLHA